MRCCSSLEACGRPRRTPLSSLRTARDGTAGNGLHALRRAVGPAALQSRRRLRPPYPRRGAARATWCTAPTRCCSRPGVCGSLPGSLKNLLEWLIGDDHTRSIYEKPVAWVNASPRGAALAHASLRGVLGYAKANVVEAACTELPIAASSLGADGLVTDPQARERLRGAMPTAPSGPVAARERSNARAGQVAPSACAHTSRARPSARARSRPRSSPAPNALKAMTPEKSSSHGRSSTASHHGSWT